MSYGLYDGDLQFYPQVPFFNLELMKLSTYYKRQREIVTLSLDFKPNMYSHFIVRQDYPYNCTYPTYPNVVYGGRAFSSSKYKPLPLDIEVMHADISLYDKVKVPHLDKSLVKLACNTMRRAEHIRLSLDEKTIWPDWEKQLRYDQNAFGVVFHDYNLAQIDGAYELIRDNIDRLVHHASGRRIGMKFPSITLTDTDFVNWYSLPKMGSHFYLQHNGILTPSIAPLIKDIPCDRNQIVINCTAGADYNEFITTGIIDLYKSMLDLRRYNIVFPLIYDKGIFADSRWVEVMELICQFNNRAMYKRGHDYSSRVAPYETLFSYAKKFVKDEKHYGFLDRRKEKYTRIFQFVRENNYELFKLFYEYTGELQ